MRGSWRPNITEIFWPTNLWPSALCLSRSPGLLNRRPRAHSAGWWLSLLHLICIFSGPQFIRAPSPFGQVWLSLPHLVSNCSATLWLSNSTGTGTRLSYIIVRRPLDLWNRMFNHHQAEITVMQFRGHSLPVHHSVVAQWDLHLSHIISLNPPTRSLSITGHWNVSLPSGASPWNSIFGPGRRSKYYKINFFFIKTYKPLDQPSALKDVAWCFKQILEAEANKTASVQAFISHHWNHRNKSSKTCWVLLEK